MFTPTRSVSYYKSCEQSSDNGLWSLLPKADENSLVERL